MGVDSGSSDATAKVTATFLMNQDSCNGTTSSAKLDITLSGNTVNVRREPLSGYTDSCTYVGTISGNCASVSGTFACGAPNAGNGQWQATISGQSTGGGPGCSLGTTWTEEEAYTGTSGCLATWTKE